MRRRVLLNWKASNTFGWGLVGLGLGLQWATDPDLQPLMGFPMAANDFPGMDAIRAMTLRHLVPAEVGRNFFGMLVRVSPGIDQVLSSQPGVVQQDLGFRGS